MTAVVVGAQDRNVTPLPPPPIKGEGNETKVIGCYQTSPLTAEVGARRRVGVTRRRSNPKDGS